MRFLLIGCTLLALLVSRAQAGEPSCATPGQDTAAVLPIDDGKEFSPIILDLTVWLGMLEEQGFRQTLKRDSEACERGAFEAASTRYIFQGEDTSVLTPRMAKSKRRGQPSAHLIPIPGFAGALESRARGQIEPAVVSAYALITVTDGYTLWRIYNAIPDDGRLMADMGAALDGRLQPRLRWRNNTMEIIAPPSEAKP